MKYITFRTLGGGRVTLPLGSFGVSENADRETGNVFLVHFDDTPGWKIGSGTARELSKELVRLGGQQ